MKRTSITLAVALLAVFGLLSALHLFSTTHAQSDNASNGERGVPETIRHKTNPQEATTGYLTAGGTGSLSAITYHNGPLINTPTIYIIWYGNWNQGNGSDNAAGQQIVRDFASSIGRLRYSFVGNANRCLNACAAQTTSPNSNAGVDGMISVMAHELEEATTDPAPRSGWADSGGAENADKCAWTFGSRQFTAPNGSIYNQTLSGGGVTRNYLIQ